MGTLSRTLLCCSLAGAWLFCTGWLHSQEIAIIPGDGKLDFKVGGKVVTSYRHGPQVAKPYFWPIVTTKGNRVTRDWPMLPDSPETKDHKHQKSAWFCHGDVIAEGLELPKKKGVEGVDFWSEEGNFGKIVCVEVGKVILNGGVPSVSTRNEWRAHDGTQILDEKRTLTLRASGNGYLIAVDCELIAAHFPITFGDTKEGSFGIRVRDSLTEKEKKGGVMTTSEGKQGEKEIWGKPAAWCDYSGPCDQGTAGIAILTDGKNSQKSCWHSRGYGLMSANPFGREKSGFPSMKGNSNLVKISKGSSLKLGFALFVHEGDAKAGGVAEAYAAYANGK
ncbi:MAG: hypothetical protein EXR99_16215 [Gemmataceae bacterium]|nr:hypothetical protein [Gemmataceae bacterium]